MAGPARGCGRPSDLPGGAGCATAARAAGRHAHRAAAGLPGARRAGRPAAGGACSGRHGAGGPGRHAALPRGGHVPGWGSEGRAARGVGCGGGGRGAGRWHRCAPGCSAALVWGVRGLGRAWGLPASVPRVRAAATRTNYCGAIAWNLWARLELGGSWALPGVNESAACKGTVCAGCMLHFCASPECFMMD